MGERNLTSFFPKLSACRLACTSCSTLNTTYSPCGLARTNPFRHPVALACSLDVLSLLRDAPAPPMDADAFLSVECEISAS